jgi:hypothetical protein
VGALVPVAPSFTRGALPLVEALDCLVGGAVVAALLHVLVARLWAERPAAHRRPLTAVHGGLAVDLSTWGHR